MSGPSGTDWLPGGREGQIAMAETWLAVIPARGGSWDIPAGEVTILQSYKNSAAAALAKVQNKAARTAVDVAECNTAFSNLAASMRLLHKKFIKPPMKDADFVALLLNPPGQPRTPIPPPDGFAEADVSYPGVGVLELYCRPVEGQPPLDRRSDWGYRIYYGVYPPGGASVEQATGKMRLLMKAPTNGDELPHSQWGRRKKERFGFNGQSGMTAYFCIRYENSKGETGPWGPLFSAVIP